MDSGCLNDHSLGPNVRGCRDDFDFTLTFERVFLAILPGSVFIASCLPRLAYLFTRPRIVGGVALQCTKLIATTAFAALQLSILILLVTGSQNVSNGLPVGAAAVPFVAAIFMLALSFTEHSRSPRPSFLLGGYILLTLLLDSAQARTSWLVAISFRETLFARLFTSSVAIKLVLLLLEAYPKSRWLRWNLDEHSPEEVNSLFDMGVFGWLNRLFVRGYSTVLSLKDLYPLDSNMTTEVLYPKLERQLRSPGYRSAKFSLAKALGKALLGPWLLPVAPRLCLIGFTFAQPLFIQSLLTYLQTPDDSDTMTRNIGYGFVGAAALIYTGIAVSNALFHYYKYRATYMIRSCLAAALYKKSTEAKSSSTDASALTLMSTDVERIVRGFESIHDFWGSIVEVAIACWLLYGHLGAAFAAPLVTILVCAGTISVVSSFSAARQRDWMGRIEKRVGMTARTIADIKGLKIAGVVDRVYDTIQALRIEEIGYGNRFRVLIIATAIFAIAPQALAPLFTFAVTSRELETTTIYTSMAYIMLVTSPLSIILQSVPTLVAAFACLGRIQDFLEAKPRVDYRKFAHARRPEAKSATSSAEGFAGVSEKPASNTLSPDTSGTVGVAADDSNTTAVAIRLSNCSFGWTADKMSLKDTSATIPAGQVSMIVGPVASGKSTFCHALLGEVPYASGEVSLHIRSQDIGFCDQSPFLLNATLQENIVGFSPFDQTKYDEIIKATRLDIDVSLMPSGHHTKVGSNGITLSGGQKQRVSLARALYLGSDMVIFDDILSGLDNDTETEVFARVFGTEGILRRHGTTTVICTHSIRHLPAADHIIALGSDGTLVEEGSFDDLMKNNMYVQSLGVKASSSSNSTASRKSAADEPSTQSTPSTKPNTNILEEKFDKARQMGDWKVYGHYFSSVSKLILAFVFTVGVLLGFGENFSTVWLGFWSEDKYSRPTSFYLGIFALFRAAHLLWIFLGCGTILLSLVSLTGATLHSDALRTVITAPLGFFTSTDIGVVTNLFSQDMTIIDGELPMALLNMLIVPFLLVGRAFVIAVATPYLACSYVVLAGVLYMVQKFYLRTSRQIRLLDLEAKSPLYSHFIDTIKGIPTIRAFAWVPQNRAHNNHLLNTSQRPAYLLIMIQQWLGLVLQLVVAALAIAVVALATQLSAEAGFAGASLVTLMNFGTELMQVIVIYTTMETSIGAVARLRTFGEEIKGEDADDEDLRPGEGWPERGEIVIRDVSASYETDVEGSEGEKGGDDRRMVLQNLSISIQPGEKVAICGRTGSGKSSLFLLLLRLLDPSAPSNENIHIDSLPLCKIHRPTLRKRIIAVPQDPVFLPGAPTLLSNLDPDNLASSPERLDVLRAVGLDTLSETPVEELSAGQKQLLSLGRAILRRRTRKGSGGVLLLDEVGSSVDGETDRMMGEVIQREFGGYTVVMIAHRLGMVREYFDRVVVLDQGRVVEEGVPGVLVGVEGSRFRELWVSGKYEDADAA